VSFARSNPEEIALKAVVIHNCGGPDILKYEDHPNAQSAPGEATVRVAAAGIDPVDLREHEGGPKDWRPVVFPGVLGRDLFGRVIALERRCPEFAGGNAGFWLGLVHLCRVMRRQSRAVCEDSDKVRSRQGSGCGTRKRLSGTDHLCRRRTKAGQIVLVSGVNGAVRRCALFTDKDRDRVVTVGVRAKDVEAASQLVADRVVVLDDDAATGALPPLDLVGNCVRGSAARRLPAGVRSKLDRMIDPDLEHFITRRPSPTQRNSRAATRSFSSGGRCFDLRKQLRRRNSQT
jgi:NADPH:quinone reductase-like Zn-dependent oxidoreductase